MAELEVNIAVSFKHFEAENSRKLPTKSVFQCYRPIVVITFIFTTGEFQLHAQFQLAILIYSTSALSASFK